MAFCAAATVVVVSAAAAAATRWNVKRMSPPPNRYTCAKPHDTPSPVGHFAGATGLARTVWFTARRHYTPREPPRRVRGLTTEAAPWRRAPVLYPPAPLVTTHAPLSLVHSHH